MAQLPGNEVWIGQAGITNSIIIAQEGYQFGVVQTGATNMSQLAQAGSANVPFVRQY
ncbi:hypothetical protein ACSBOB_09615 [Mesorhizobium sp. ASY16-5R]|uniref:hypothetical protein n=1 Tax=Mesorhizobium sp. ASY16-5R TaxID=3445772 RepID=UPI003FA02899